MNVSQAAIGEYFLLGSGTGFVYEKFGDNGTPEHPKPVIYKYNWQISFVEALEPDPYTPIYPIKVSVHDPYFGTQIVMSLELGEFFLRDTEPDHYYQYFMGDYQNTVVTLKFDRETGQYLDVIQVPDHEIVRGITASFVLR